jgi:hypothetical protein
VAKDGGRTWQAIAIAGAVLAALLVIAGFASGGFSGGLIMAGLMSLLLGVGAAIAGRARWAFIASRKTAGIVAAAGLVALIVGGATAPPAATSTASSMSQEQEQERVPEPEVDGEAAIAAAEEALAAAEERAVPEGAGAPGQLADAAAEQAVADAAPTTALAALAAVEVKGRAPRNGYDRDLFGSAWSDVDRNGCDTRNDMLQRDLTGETFKPGTRNCVVLTGTLDDPYSGRAIAFQRGQSTSDDVQIDHVVALSDAWQKGAQGLEETRRRAFANDPLNLLAVDGPLNMQKGDGDAATWLPPN